MFRYVLVLAILFNMLLARDNLRSLRDKCYDKKDAIACVMLADLPGTPESTYTECILDACRYGDSFSCEEVADWDLQYYLKDPRNHSSLSSAKWDFSKACSADNPSACSFLSYTYRELGENKEELDSLKWGCKFYNLYSCEVLVKRGYVDIPNKVYNEIKKLKDTYKGAYSRKYFEIQCFNNKTPEYYCKELITQEGVYLQINSFSESKRRDILPKIRKYVMNYCKAIGYKDNIKECPTYKAYQKNYLK
ncbi:hypothetical protein [Campylobacter fetus]|uniref:hypothetical protein n=1 Tax=Campylobacter fetus TaxID=196 RepID=UPI00138E547B|nr:hypothetical protein [Campylobacter fetus]